MRTSVHNSSQTQNHSFHSSVPKISLSFQGITSLTSLTAATNKPAIYQFTSEIGLLMIPKDETIVNHVKTML